MLQDLRRQDAVGGGILNLQLSVGANHQIRSTIPWQIGPQIATELGRKQFLVGSFGATVVDYAVAGWQELRPNHRTERVRELPQSMVTGR